MPGLTVSTQLVSTTRESVQRFLKFIFKHVLRHLRDHWLGRLAPHLDWEARQFLDINAANKHKCTNEDMSPFSSSAAVQCRREISDLKLGSGVGR